MPRYDYSCPNCGIKEVVKRIQDAGMDELCECGLEMSKVYGKAPGVHGGRDGFEEFYDTDSKKMITTNKEWEKAGYKNLSDKKHHPRLERNIKMERDKAKYSSGKKVTI